MSSAESEVAALQVGAKGVRKAPTGGKNRQAELSTSLTYIRATARTCCKTASVTSEQLRFGRGSVSEKKIHGGGRRTGGACSGENRGIKDARQRAAKAQRLHEVSSK